MIPETASSLELWWTGMALPGLLLSLYCLAGAIGDLRHHWRDGLRGMGWIGLVKVVGLCLMAVLVIAAGGVAIVTPDPIRPEVREAADLISGFLMAIDALILVLAVAFTVERGYLVKHVHVRPRGEVLS